MASVREIAKQVGVSAATVSRALRGHPDISTGTRQRIVMAANKAGYASPRMGAMDSEPGVAIGYVSTTPSPVLSLYDCMLLNGTRRGLRGVQGLTGTGLDVQFVDLHRDKPVSESYTAFFTRRRLQGVVVQVDADHRGICRAITDEGYPCVALAEEFPEPDVSYVCCDASREIGMMMDHLIQLGHERIGLAVQRPDDHDHHNRISGYEQALREHGIEPDPSLIVRIAPSREGGGHAINELMSRREPPTAVFVADPFPAIGALCRAHEIGLEVPGQLSIVGFDDGQMRRQVYPLLTAVCQPTEEIGSLAAQWLSKRILGEVQEPLRRVLPASFEVNQTTASPPAKPVRIEPSGQRMRTG
ncbi:LacI family DNA-binding transcriptional regulator [Mucisphaera sp.]|uniref:LacI family DNA-binding transcriptional regulator n=1 Tax=Mucisphaera sp. TaxID=2913024 RepID=UPI003D13E219